MSYCKMQARYLKACCEQSDSFRLGGMIDFLIAGKKLNGWTKKAAKNKILYYLTDERL